MPLALVITMEDFFDNMLSGEPFWKHKARSSVLCSTQFAGGGGVENNMGRGTFFEEKKRFSLRRVQNYQGAPATLNQFCS